MNERSNEHKESILQRNGRTDGREIKSIYFLGFDLQQKKKKKKKVFLVFLLKIGCCGDGFNAKWFVKWKNERKTRGKQRRAACDRKN